MRTLSSFLVAGLGIVTAGGCGQTASNEDYDDVAANTAALIAADDAAEDGAIDATDGGDVDGLTRDGTGTWSGDRLGLEWRYELSCLDADGAVLDPCTREADTAHLTVDWSGTIDLLRYHASASRSGDWTLSNLQGDVAQLDGTGSFDMDSEFQALRRDVTRTMHLEYDAVWNAVQLSRAERRAIGGSATFQVHGERTRDGARRDVEAEFDVEAVVTFQADGSAQLELDGSRTYRIDVATGEVTAE
jgi:hypothetical protein